MTTLKILFILILTIILTTINTSISVFSDYDQNFLLPFSYKEVWDTNVINKRDDYGIHQDKIGVGIDFYTNRSLETLAPVSGMVTKGCVSKGVTSIIITRPSSQVIRLVHLLDNTIKISSGYVKQGDPIGMTAPRGDYNGENCNVSSDDYHVHLSIGTRQPNTCKFLIDGYNFDCSGMRPCSKSLSGLYNLTFAVNCNRKYLNQQFVSTNGFPLNKNQCNDLTRKVYDNKIDKNQENILNLQVCLKKSGLYNGVYSRVYDDKTKKLVNQIFEPAKEIKKEDKTPIVEEPKVKIPVPTDKTIPKVEPKKEPDPILVESPKKEPELIIQKSTDEVKEDSKDGYKEENMLNIVSKYIEKNNIIVTTLSIYLGLLLIITIF